MTIVFVIDFFTPINGTSMTAIRFRNELIKRGHKVRVVSVGVEGEDMYSLKERYLPIASDVTRKQSMVFAKPDEKVLELAFKDADIIHFFLPYKLAYVGHRVAERMGIPHLIAFHCQPENVTYSLGLGWCEPFANYIYNRFNKKFYQYFDHIHTPSAFIGNELIKHNYKSKLHIFSNGVSEKFIPSSSEKKDRSIFKILMTGRLVAEKRQDVLLKAIPYSKYKDKIQLIFAGKGPKEKYYKKLGEKLPNKPIFGFYSEDELIKIIQDADLYVHTSDIEIEAISCLEAMACGRVPVIANSKKSATPQFALDERSLFNAGDYKDLAKKIDYWIEHEEERLLMEKRYAEESEKYKMHHIIQKTEEMYKEVINDYKIKHPVMMGKNQKTRPFVPKLNYIPPEKGNIHIRETERVVNIKFDEKYPYVNKNPFFKLLSNIIHIIIFLIVFSMVYFKFNLKIKGKNNLKKLKKEYKGGIITVSNHIHEWDYLCCLKAVFPKKLYCPVVKENIESKERILMRLCNMIPIPDTSFQGMKVFIKTIDNLLKKKKIIHFYPESALWWYYQPIREFENGAFFFAVRNRVPILPMAFSYRQGPKEKVYFTLTIGKPLFPDLSLKENEAIEKLKKETKAEVIRCAGIEE